MTTDYYKLLSEDVRFVEGLTACINCGTCTAICPAAEFYEYDPRIIADTVQSRDNEKIAALLKSDTIWYCGECMSCKTRCPRNNTPGYIIIALRYLSHITGLFVESEKGRQSLAIKRTTGEEILRSGYCMFVDRINNEMHPEQGPVWEWVRNNAKAVYERCGGNYNGDGAGALRNIPAEALHELHKIFDETGGTAFFELIEEHSKRKAAELGIEFTGKGTTDEYFRFVFTANNDKHTKL
jgi:heterodisulfide reductase subunit C